MGIMETVKRGFGITNRNIGLILIMFVFNLVGALLRVPVAGATPGAPVSGAVVGASIVLGLIGVLIFGGVLGSLKEFIKTQKSELTNFIKYGAKFYLRILGVWILVALIVIVFSVLAAVGLSISITVKNLVGVVISLALALIIGAIGIYFFILLLMGPYILVADDIGPVAALKTSVNFVRSSLLKIIGLFLLLILVSIGIGFVVGLIAGLINLVIKGTASQIIIGIVGSAFNAYINVLLPACFLLIYMSSRKTEEQPTTTP